MYTLPLQKKKNRGVTLLIAVLITSLVLAIGLAILNITLRNFLLSSIARDSAVAFFAADAGLECAKYWNDQDIFDADRGSNNIRCFGQSQNVIAGPASANSGTEFDLSDFTWTPRNARDVCTSVKVTKYQPTVITTMPGTGRRCPADSECTVIEAWGYNKSCSTVSSGDIRISERALRRTIGGCVPGGTPACP